MNNKGRLTPVQLIQEFYLGNEDLNQRLEQYILGEMQRAELKTKAQHSNIGGWQSERDLHARLGDSSPGSKLLLELFASFSPSMMQYISVCHAIFDVAQNGNYDWNYTGAWFNISAKGGYNAPHTHPLSQISAAYYIRTEEPTMEYPFSGRIDFIHENITYHFFPKPGTLILFPSDMLHFVHPYYGTGYRMCLSFNADNIHTI